MITPANRASRIRESGIAPHAALILVQIMFGTWPLVGKIALRYLPSTALVAFRTVGAALAFALLLKLTGPHNKIKKEDWPLLIVCSLLGVVFNQLLFVKGLSITTVINATLLSTTIPVFTLVISIFLGRDRATVGLVMGILLAAGGVLFLINPLRAEFSRAHSTGDLLIVVNSISYGAYIAFSKKLVKRYSALVVITWIFIISSIVTIPIGALNVSAATVLNLPALVWLSVIYIILVPTVGAYYLNAWALARVTPSTVAVYIYLQPLIAFALAPLLLGETWGWRTVIAAGLIFTGVALVTIRKRSRALKEVSEHPEALGH